jgi:gas vesicle protein
VSSPALFFGTNLSYWGKSVDIFPAEDEKPLNQVDSESADDGKSSVDPLSPAVSQQQQDPSSSDAAAAADAGEEWQRRFKKFQEDMNRNTMRLEEYIRELRAERGLSERPERRSAAVPISYFLGG